MVDNLDSEFSSNTGDETKPVSKEIPSTHETEGLKSYLEQSRTVGDFYTSFIGNLSGKKNEANVSLDGLDKDTKKTVEEITRSTLIHKTEQQLKVGMNGLTAKDLLAQAFTSEEKSKLLEDTNKYSLEEPSNGIFIISVDDDMYFKLYDGSQALAVKLKEGVSFVMLPKYSDDKSNQTIRKENVPHETHHIAWSFAQRDGLIKCTETEPEMQKAFYMYQDEIIARMVSNGFLSGYSHLRVMNAQARDDLQKNSPETVSKIQQATASMNENLEKIELQRKQTGLRKQDFIMSAITATSFNELSKNLSQMEQVMNTLPHQPETSDLTPDTGSSPGWGNV